MKPKYNEKLRDKLCDYIRAGNTADNSCILCSISDASFYKWQLEYIKDKKGNEIKNKNYHIDLVDSIKKAQQDCEARNIGIIQRAAVGRKLKRTKTLKDGTVVEEEYDADKPNWFAAAWWLERTNKKRFALRQEITGEEGGKIEAMVIYKPEKNKE